jgi:hypothetical protein
MNIVKKKIKKKPKPLYIMEQLSQEINRLSCRIDLIASSVMTAIDERFNQCDLSYSKKLENLRNDFISIRNFCERLQQEKGQLEQVCRQWHKDAKEGYLGIKKYINLRFGQEKVKIKTALEHSDLFSNIRKQLNDLQEKVVVLESKNAETHSDLDEVYKAYIVNLNSKANGITQVIFHGKTEMNAAISEAKKEMNEILQAIQKEKELFQYLVQKEKIAVEQTSNGLKDGFRDLTSRILRIEANIN